MRKWLGTAAAVTPSIIGAILLPAVLTRQLRPTEFGRYAITIGIATLTSTVLYGWVVVALGRLLPGRDYEFVQGLRLAAWRLSFWAAAVAAMSGLVLVIAGASVIGGGLIAGSLLTPLNVAIGEAKARQHTTQFMVLSTAQTGAQVGGAIVATVILASSGVAVAAASALCTTAVALLSFDHPRQGSMDPSVRKEFLRVGVPFLPAALALMVLSVGDRFIVAYRLGESSAGLYAAVFSVMFRPLNLFAQVVQTMILPEASRRANMGTVASGTAYLRRLITPVLALSIVLSLALFVGHDLVLLVLEGTYRDPPTALLLGAIGAGLGYIVYSLCSIRVLLYRLSAVNTVAIVAASALWATFNLVHVHSRRDISSPALSLGLAYLGAATASTGFLWLRGRH